ncbi:MAG: isoprenylcysteine carboxylmethyltransferase family protein [Pseudomonadota bacterium]
MPSSTPKTVSVLLTPQILQMLAKVYLPVLFPLTFLIALLGFALDRWLHLPATMLASPWNLVVGGAIFLAGGVIWLVSYAAIVFEGKGSPSPTAGRTQQLVTTGIYSLCRYPSVHAKFLGVLGLGVALNCWTFTFALCPLLLAGSLIEKQWRQEPQNEAVFGEAWVAYRRRVPFFIPWRVFLPRR